MLAAWRRNRLRRHPDPQIAAFYRTPPPRLKQVVRQTRLLSVDLETTGLAPSADVVLSVAAIPIRDGVIAAGDAYYRLIRQERALSDAVVIHGITAADMTAAADPPRVIAELLPLLAGAVLLGHNAAMDWRFLNQLLVRQCRAPLIVPVVDTLRVERARLALRDAVHLTTTLDLSACRRRYDLPEFAQHDARNDAFATAELFLAQVGAKGGADRVRLADLGARSLG